MSGRLNLGTRHFGLTKAEVTRRASLTERGLAEYKELCERARSAESPAPASKDPGRPSVRAKWPPTLQLPAAGRSHSEPRRLWGWTSKC